MLTISKRQLKVLGKSCEAHYYKRLNEQMRVWFPGQTVGLTDNALRTKIEGWSREAEDYGLTWQSSIAAFVCLQLAGGRGVSEWEPVKRVLLDQSAPQKLRVKELKVLVEEMR